LGGADFPRWVLIDIAGLWQSSKDFLNSNFFTAIAGACAGAFAGAYGAQRIVARGKEREELLAEIRNTNAATVVALGICNTFLAIKKQHVKRLKETFDKQKADYLARAHKYRMCELPPGDTAPALLFDLQVLVLPPFDLPLDTLRHQIFEKISLSNRRALMLVTSLTETAHGLNTSISNRNRLIAFYHAYRKIDQLTPIVSQTKQIRNCGNSLLKQLIEGDKDFFRDGSLVAYRRPAT
jgi:hypothetical protein